jgi:uncharacterized membrane protein
MKRPRRRPDSATGEVVIGRPVHEVYTFYRDFSNMPRFLDDVVAVRRVADGRYRWIVAGPLGTRIPLTIVVVDERMDRLVRFRSSGPPWLRGGWELSFTEDARAGSTRVRERLVMPLGALGRAVLAMVEKFPQREVAENLTALKRVLEADEPNRPRIAEVPSVHLPAPRR